MQPTSVGIEKGLIIMDFYNNKIDDSYELNNEKMLFFSNLIDDYDKSDIIDETHDKRHLYQVTNAMLYIGNKLGLNLHLCLAIGALHDIGLLSGDRKNHHEKSAEWVRNNTDVLLGIGYSSTEIDIIETSVREHRSSGNIKSSIYSQAITDADKIPTHNVDAIIQRALSYTKAHNVGLTNDDIFEKMYDHVHEKYGKGDYGNKFYTQPAINLVKSENHDIIKVMNDRNLCLNKCKFDQ